VGLSENWEFEVKIGFILERGLFFKCSVCCQGSTCVLFYVCKAQKVTQEEEDTGRLHEGNILVEISTTIDSLYSCCIQQPPHSPSCWRLALLTVGCCRCNCSFCFTACPPHCATSFHHILKALEQEICVGVDSTAVAVVANCVARWVAGVSLKEPGSTTRTYPAGCVIGVVWRV
jgi:hypothetical protein